MSTTVGRFRPLKQQVSITDGKVQVQFDRPADMARWLEENPEYCIEDFEWTTQEITGGH